MNWQSVVSLSPPEIPKAWGVIKCIAVPPQPTRGVSHSLPDLGVRQTLSGLFLASGVLLILAIHDLIDVPLR